MSMSHWNAAPVGGGQQQRHGDDDSRGPGSSSTSSSTSPPDVCNSSTRCILGEGLPSTTRGSQHIRQKTCPFAEDGFLPLTPLTTPSNTRRLRQEKGGALVRIFARAVVAGRVNQYTSVFVEGAALLLFTALKSKMRKEAVRGWE